MLVVVSRCESTCASIDAMTSQTVQCWHCLIVKSASVEIEVLTVPDVRSGTFDKQNRTGNRKKGQEGNKSYRKKSACTASH